MHPRKAHPTHEIKTLLELCLRLARESHDDVRRDRNARHGAAYILDETCERRRIIVAVHRGKNAVAPRLERQMQVRCKARLGADELEQIVRQLDRLE